jgi:hypothetical protein
VLSGEATDTNFIVLHFTRLGLEPTIYRTRACSRHDVAETLLSLR